MRTVVIGIGNELCADDAVGLAVVRRLAAEGVAEAVEAGCPGLGLLDLLDGYDRAILVDAVVSGAPPGTLHEFTLHDLPDRKWLPLSLHGVNAVDALALGQIVEPERLPPDVIIFGVEIADRTPFRAGLTPAVSDAIGQMAERIRKTLTP
ncbi:MAG TPA: hydrogenase maturation protease [Symbiobacteriaceae bacterium]|nr:hydrogenase maturation protease [Symbiobacteriaceae bacterium]